MKFSNFKNNLKHISETFLISMLVMFFFDALPIAFDFKEFNFKEYLISVIVVTIFTMFFARRK